MLLGVVHYKRLSREAYMGNQLSSFKPDFRDICKNINNVTLLTKFFFFGNRVSF